MTTSVARKAGQVEEYLEAFESMLARDGGADLANFLPPPSHGEYRAVLRELIRIDLDNRWTQGRRPMPLAGYRHRFPEAFVDDEDRAAIAFEEYRLRIQAGERPVREDYQQDFQVPTADWPLPDRSSEMALAGARFRRHSDNLPPTNIVEAELPDAPRRSAPKPHGAHETAGWQVAANGDTGPALPEVGSEFLGFRLVHVLGNGAFGRVFLAEQAALANRLVALKVSTDRGGESQRLAQLQHTNIVPIYSTHRDGDLQAVCMPYFGGTTLADVIESLARGASFPKSGRELISTLHARRSTMSGLSDTAANDGAASEVKPETPAPAPECQSTVVLDKLAAFNYVDAVLWLMDRLADGLAHAHERGILHCDLKPANILLSDEGQPMLLDFNLALDAKLRQDPAKALRGGTLAYMAPENLEALTQRKGNVDARSDIYALGLILYELLAGRHPYPPPMGQPLRDVVDGVLAARRVPPLRLQPFNTAVTPAVEAIVRRCLESEPARRYPTARALQEDVQAQLANLPLKHTREPSWRERAQKWLRRHPRVTSSSSVGIVAALLLGVVASLWVMRGQRLLRLEADATLQEFRKDAGEARFLLTHVNEQAFRDQGLLKCRAALDHYQALVQSTWRDLPAVRQLPEENQTRLADEIGEMLLLYTSATLPPPGEAKKSPIVLEQALQRTALARACFESGKAPRALGLQRAQVLQLLGKDAEARQAKSEAEQQPLTTAHEYYLAAKEHFQAGEYREAMPLLQQAVDLEPEHYWATFLIARCHDQSGDQRAAIAAYRTCVALQPQQYGAWFNRGLAHLRLKDHRRALADFDHAQTLRPGHAELYFNRALAQHGLQKWQAALADLNRAEELGCALTRIFFLRARVRGQLGDKEGAERDRAMGLSREPADDLSWNARGFVRLDTDPRGALDDFEKALEQNPRSLPALENKAYVLSELLRLTPEAIGALDQAVALYPDHVAARASRGVLLARLGRRQAALEDAKESLLRNADAATQYQVAGIYALTSRTHGDDALQALALLGTALRSGYGLNLLESDTDLDPIRNRPEFQRLLKGVKSLQP